MFNFFRRLKEGEKLMSSLLTGEFDNSDVGKQLTAWFAEREEREEQRTTFIEAVTAMGGKPEFAATKLMDCIMKSWGGERFGELLAQKIGEGVSFPPPKDAFQAEHQRKALSILDGIKTQLRSLDA